MYDARVPVLWRKVRINLNDLEVIQSIIFLGFGFGFHCLNFIAVSSYCCSVKTKIKYAVQHNKKLTSTRLSRRTSLM